MTHQHCVTLIVAAILSTGAGQAAPSSPSEGEGKAMNACRSVAEDRERLACFDRLAARLAPPSFSGRLTATTDRFTVSTPTMLRYESDGPIFVMYLKNDAGDVLQNLHIGGGGQERYVIEQPGTYFLTISGSETWRVWLDPK